MEEYPEELSSAVPNKGTPVRFMEDVGATVSSVKKTGSSRRTTKAAIEGWTSSPQTKRSVFRQNNPTSERKKSMVKAKALNFSASKSPRAKSTPRGKFMNTSNITMHSNKSGTPTASGKDILRTIQMKMKVALYGDDVTGFFKRSDKDHSGKAERR
jgi:hypothetical protein